MPNPAIDAPDLCLEICIDRLDSLVFALEFIADVAVHLVVALAHLFNALSALFSLHSIFDIDLVANIVDLASPLFLLRKQSIHQVSHLHFHTVGLVVLNLGQHISEFIRVFKSINLEAADIFFFFPLLHVH